MTTTAATEALAAGATVRAGRIAAAVHSARMEGLEVSPAFLADAQEVIQGRIDADELVDRTRARYGVGQ